jgi:uncharacterized membrane protein
LSERIFRAVRLSLAALPRPFVQADRNSVGTANAGGTATSERSAVFTSGTETSVVLQPVSVARPIIRSTARIGSHPIHPILVPIPIACFVGTLLTDLMYWQTAAVTWADFSAWLVTVGTIVGWLAAIAGLIDFFGNRLVRRVPPAWPHAVGNIAVLVAATFNTLIHSRDAYTSVVPTGLILSALTVLILLFTGWLGWSMVYRYRIGGAP